MLWWAKNGAGKKYAAEKFLAGARNRHVEKVSAPKDCVVAYLPQHLMTEDGRTVFDETAQAFFTSAWNGSADWKTEQKSSRHGRTTRATVTWRWLKKCLPWARSFYSIDATNYEEDVEKALLGLGFTRSDFQRQTSDFSGGWRMRIELAKLLLQKPDVLLLDEPTNHLDIESIQWLEDFLINNGKAVIVISHDRKIRG